MEKLDSQGLKDLLEQNGYQLSDARHMKLSAYYSPWLDGRATRKIISVLFNGTTHLGEVLAVVVHFIRIWTIQQRLVRLEFQTQSMKEEEIAQEHISVLFVIIGVESHSPDCNA